MDSNLLAVLPLFSCLFCILALSWSGMRALCLGAFLALTISYFFWQSPLESILAAGIKAFVNSIDIFLIVFGALSLYEALSLRGRLKQILAGLDQLCSDRTLIVLLLSWLLVAFFEGAAGFGTPAAIVAPLLVSLGVQPTRAVILCLLGDTAAVTFGAVGTPIFGGLQALEAFLKGEYESFLFAIGWKSSLLNLMLLSFMPVFMLLLIRKDIQSKSPPFKTWIAALLMGVSFTSLQILVAYFISAQLASILAAFVSILFSFLLLKILQISDTNLSFKTIQQQGKAWSPYIMALFILLITRFDFLPIKAFLKSISFQTEQLLETNIRVSWSPFYNPGLFPFLFLGLLYSEPNQRKKVLKMSIQKLLPALPVLFFGVLMVSAMNHSGKAEQESMILSLARFSASSVSDSWYLFAPFLGILGAFISGSATVSNILFGSFQYSIAELAGFSKSSVLALQSFGSSIGNMICLHNIVAALAILGLSGQEAKILRFNLPICLLLGFLAGSLASIFFSKSI